MKKLEDLVGLHTLTGVESGYVKDKQWDDNYEDCNYISFILDGIQYTAIEDPSDGYRSCMSRLITKKKVKIKNVFPEVKVFGYMKENDTCKDYDVFILLSVKNAKKILEVGTENIVDYYPCFVANFYPENMPINKNRKPK